MAKKLSREAFQRAAQFIKDQARPLDRALFAYYFEDGDGAGVARELARFQNDDGGFGHCLEPDFRLAASSVMATSLALQYLQKIEAPAGDPLVGRAIGYLVGELDEASLSWRPVPQAIDGVPRAPWWSFEIWDQARQTPQGWANPGAEVTGYFLAYPSLVSQSLTAKLADRAFRALAALEDESTPEMHAFLCLVHWAEHLTGAQKHEVERRLAAVSRRIVGFDEAAWQGYGLRPHWVVSSPDAALYPALSEALETCLTWEIDQQAADGSWQPFWAWGQYEAEWQTARREWAGHLTVKMLKTLSAFGRLAP